MKAQKCVSRDLFFTSMAKKIFEKQILRIGEWKHKSAPGGVLRITKDYVSKLAENFKKIPTVPVYRSHIEDSEAEKNPELIVSKNIKNLGIKDDGLYAEFEIDDSEIDKYNDVSASIQPEYEDHETGNSLGPVLRHIAMVNNPYIKGLNPFVALEEGKNDYFILLSEINMEEIKTDLEEVKTAAETVESKEETVETKVETEKETDETTTETAEVTAEVVAEVKTEVVADLSEKGEDELTMLRKANAEMRKQLEIQTAEGTYQNLLRQGKILPSIKSEFIALSSITTQTVDLADGTKKSVGELLNDLFEKMPQMVNLTEKGVQVEQGSKSIIPDDMRDKLYKQHVEDLKDVKAEEFDTWVEEYSSIINKHSKK